MEAWRSILGLTLRACYSRRHRTVDRARSCHSCKSPQAAVEWEPQRRKGPIHLGCLGAFFEILIFKGVIIKMSLIEEYWRRHLHVLFHLILFREGAPLPRFTDEGIRLKKIKWLVLGHKACKSWDWNPGLSPSCVSALSPRHIAGTGRRPCPELAATSPNNGTCDEAEIYNCYFSPADRAFWWLFSLPSHTEWVISWETITDLGSNDLFGWKACRLRLSDCFGPVGKLYGSMENRQQLPGRSRVWWEGQRAGGCLCPSSLSHSQF